MQSRDNHEQAKGDISGSHKDWSPMARRTYLKAWDKRLLMRIRQGYWTADELQWVLDHLDEHAPTLVIQEIHDKLVEVRGAQR
jgi:hypothetical protein